MDELSDLLVASPRPTPARPLQGLTILIVEDSRYASEALRLLCLRSGARIRRADCLMSAKRHLQTYRPSVAIIDLGLPDGSGLDLIKTLSTATQRPLVILATSGMDRATSQKDATDAGADGFLAKPLDSIASFQQAILHNLPTELRPKGVRLVGEDRIEPDPFAMQEDLAQAAKLLADDASDDQFIAGFIKGIARTSQDLALLTSAQALGTNQAARAKLRALIDSRLQNRKAV